MQRHNFPYQQDLKFNKVSPLHDFCTFSYGHYVYFRNLFGIAYCRQCSKPSKANVASAFASLTPDQTQVRGSIIVYVRKIQYLQ